MNTAKIRIASDNLTPLPINAKITDFSWITAVEIDLVKGNEIDIDFHVGATLPYTAQNLIAALEDLTKKNPTLLRNVGHKGKRLTIHNDHDNRILLIRVSNKMKNLSFSSLKLPILRGDNNPDLLANLEIYGPNWKSGTASLRLYDDATVQRGEVGGIVAKFTVEGTKAPVDDFFADFNINLDWRDLDPHGNELSVIPIMIDPDTRYPGGTNP